MQDSYTWARRLLTLIATTMITTGCLSSSGGGGDPIAHALGGGSGSQSGSLRISGTAAPAVTTGSNYSFTPTATNPEGDALNFTIQNKPYWATFNASTGKLSGVAAVGTEGIYDGIRIAVSDGQNTAALPEFAVEVTQSALGTVSLSWQPPTQNEDGSPLVDLAGFKIYYGTTSGDYDNSIEIDNSGIASYMVENLSPNTYYFASTAINTDGDESDFSNEAVKVVN